MKLEIWDESPVEVEEPVRLVLSQDRGESTNITVVVMGRQGNKMVQGNLISFLPDGTIYRHKKISPDFGFSLDRKGRIKMEGQV